jgi:hypothetical protein
MPRYKKRKFRAADEKRDSPREDFTQTNRKPLKRRGREDPAGIVDLAHIRAVLQGKGLYDF